MVRAKKRFEFEKVLAICEAFTGQKGINPYEEQKVLKWGGWKAYGIHIEGKGNGTDSEKR